tara:strand:- start:51 stop:1142 length:1092 start_codon:yes stop_codon:yes gene_type:complete
MKSNSNCTDLTYITRRNISSTAAQAKQIYAMSCAFNHHKRINFKIICKAKNDDKYPFTLERLKRSGFIGIIELFVHIVKNKSKKIYTRDIFVAFVATFFWGQACYEIHDKQKSSLNKLVLKFILLFPKLRIVFISNGLADHYRNYYKINEHKFLISHCGVNLDNYLGTYSKKRLRQELGLPLDKKIIMHTGSLYKGGSEFFNEIIENLAGNEYFVHVGGNKKEIEHITNLNTANEGKFLFTEQVSSDQIAKFQLSSDALFFISTEKSPIHFFTSPLKIFEYMACKKPIIGCIDGAAGEILNESNCLTFSLSDNNSLKRAVNVFQNDASKCKQVSQTAHRQSKTQYSYDCRVKNIIGFLNFKYQ